MLKLSKVESKETIFFPVKDTKWDINKCYGYPYECFGGFAIAPY